MSTAVRKKGIRRNIKPAFLLVVISVLAGVGAVGFVLSSAYGEYLASNGAARLAAGNWRDAANALQKAQPTYDRKSAYYVVQDGQTLPEIASFFGVDPAKLAALNPGTTVTGTTLKITPIEAPFTPIAAANGQIATARVTDVNGLVRVRQLYKLPEAQTTIPELMQFLKPFNAIEEVAPKVFRINRPISLDENIRLDITDATVKRLELRSSPNDITCLCFDGSNALIQNVDITSVDPATNQPDRNPDDQRSFIRIKSSRVDVLNSRVSYLGNGLLRIPEAEKPFLQREGGSYGISWRIPDDALGKRITTGWVEGNLFYRNHFGSYTFGASGMTWKNNHYLENDVYGLDPHDDSNNALVEDDLFERNGKHGFIVSKRCNYNVIRNNTSVGNKLHGFMLHQDSAYNVFENNISYGNADNFAIYASDFNTIRNNKSYNARISHIRINEKSRNTYITGNQLYGAGKGIYLYGKVDNVFVANNTIKLEGSPCVLATNEARHVLFANNTIHRLRFDIASSDQVVFGENTINKEAPAIPAAAARPIGFTLKSLAGLQ